jgi:hypothetical protein
MPIILVVESTTIVSSITTFEPILIPMFFHFDFFKEFRSKSLHPKFSTAIITIIITVIKGGGKNYEKQFKIIDGEGQFDQNVLIFGKQFKTQYDHLVMSKNLVNVLWCW